MHKATPQLILILAAGFAMGAINSLLFGASSAPAPWSTVEKLTLVAFVYWWFHVDARERNYSVGWPLRVGVILLAIVAVPVYFFRSRGGVVGAQALAKMLGFMVLWVATFAIGISVGDIASA